MIGKRALAWIGIGFLAIIFISVFSRVIAMRIEKGDIYPHYATLRTDPLGSSALFEAFSKMPDLTVERNTQNLMRVDTVNKDTTLFLLGMPSSQLGSMRVPEGSKVMQAIEKNGARLVITLNPGFVPEEGSGSSLFESDDEWLRDIEEEIEKAREKDEKNEDGDQEKKEKKETTFEKKKREFEEQQGVKLIDLVGIKLAKVGKFERPEEGWEVEPGETLDPEGMTEYMPIWRSQHRFEIAPAHDDKWKVAAAVDGKPVVAERNYGNGTIVISTDSYFASNESLYTEPATEFLLWLSGGKTKLIFDETLHGTVEKIGAMNMIRHYRAHGLIIGLVILAILWAWRSSSSLAPGDEATERGLIGNSGAVSGEDSKTGFIKLLRRSIPANALLDHCLATWKSSQVTDIPPEKEDKISQILQRHRKNPKAQTAPDTYRQIAEILKKR